MRCSTGRTSTRSSKPSSLAAAAPAILHLRRLPGAGDRQVLDPAQQANLGLQKIRAATAESIDNGTGWIFDTSPNARRPAMPRTPPATMVRISCRTEPVPVRTESPPPPPRAHAHRGRNDGIARVESDDGTQHEIHVAGLADDITPIAGPTYRYNGWYASSLTSQKAGSSPRAQSNRSATIDVWVAMENASLCGLATEETTALADDWSDDQRRLAHHAHEMARRPAAWPARLAIEVTADEAAEINTPRPAHAGRHFLTHIT